MTRNTRRGLAAALVVVAHAASAHAQSMASANGLRRWADAVIRHRPGRPDEAVAYAASLKYSDRLQLNPAMQLFLREIRGEGVATRSAGQQQITNRFRALRADPGLAGFLRRAAILHTDAALFADRFPAPVDDAPAPDRLQQRRRVEPPPLLFDDRYVLHTDGRVVGSVPADWNLPFARSLLDLLLPNPARRTEFAPDRDYVATWYHALDAYLLAVGNHGALYPHLQHAATVLPDEADVLFDRGCYAETLGLPYNQVLREDPGFVKTNGLSLYLPTEERTDAEAERLFERAIAVRPDYAEARVRLARLLALRGRYDEAIDHLSQAAASKPTSVVAYYLELVRGRVAQLQRRFSDSSGHYAAAVKLFPDAQSALLGASQAAVMAADMPGALSFVQKLGPRSQAYEADPWRDYKIGAGRDANDLLAALWTSVAKQ
jgi:tetratricopeptide (TPR) repeat protein